MSSLKLDHIYIGHCVDILKQLPPNSVHCCVTSPPYWNMRDYNGQAIPWADGWNGHLGLESSLDAYVTHIVEVFQAVHRVLRKDGTLWLNLGDTYVKNARPGGNIGITDRKIKESPFPYTGVPLGLKPRDLCGVPWRVAFALQAAGWFLRRDIIWHKTNPKPESVKTRPSSAHEYLFLFSKSVQYFYDCDAIREPYPQSTLKRFRGSITTKRKYGIQSTNNLPFQNMNRARPALNEDEDLLENRKGLMHPLGRNKKSVWTLAINARRTEHTAPYPEKLIEPCILAGCPENGIVLDPFMGSGTTALVSKRLNRHFVGIELNPSYVQI